MLAVELSLEKLLRHIRSRKLSDGFFPGDVIAFDRALGQTLLELRVRARKLGVSFVSSHVIAFDRTLGQTLFDFCVGEVGEYV
jgi:hypothetical protein